MPPSGPAPRAAPPRGRRSARGSRPGPVLGAGSCGSAPPALGSSGDPPPHVAAFGVELAALAGGVEDPEVRRRVRPTAGRPLPAVLVGGEVAVDQPVQEVPRTVLPLQVQVLDQEAGDDHPHPVVHPPGGPQLAHAGVHDREAGPSLLPRLELGAGLVVRHPGVLRAQVVASGLGPAGTARRRRTRARRAPCGRCGAGAARPGQVGEHRARVDLAVLQVHRQPRGALDAGLVAVPS